jgi:hypothetical protein
MTLGHKQQSEAEGKEVPTMSYLHSIKHCTNVEHASAGVLHITSMSCSLYYKHVLSQVLSLVDMQMLTCAVSVQSVPLFQSSFC